MISSWLTYAWLDNEDRDVDYVAQELKAAGINIKLDKWDLLSGSRLWEQIDSFIQDKDKSDAWLFFATENSLNNPKCMEEYYYALDRALNSRGEKFPIIAIFPSSVDKTLIPAGIKTRLYVSLADDNWKERVLSGLRGEQSIIREGTVSPFYLKVHRMVNESTEQNYAIEMRPRAGQWSPFMVLVPLGEKGGVHPNLVHGHAGSIPMASQISISDGSSKDGNWWYIKSSNQATPSQSFYLICKELPREIGFGPVQNGQISGFTVKKENFSFD